MGLLITPAGGGTTSPLTTKGDLYGYDTAGNRIPVGTNDQVLTADSAQTLGLKWATSTVPVKATAAELNTGTDDTKFATALALASRDGWQSAGETWTYATASTFTVTGDQTTKYTVGTKLKFTQTTVKYAVVLSSSYGANTTVTILVNTGYTIANAAISANYYSYMTNPQGWPGWFALAAPTFNAAGAGGLDDNAGGQPTVSETRINIEGRSVKIHMRGTGYKVTTDYYFYITTTGFPAIANTTEQTILGIGHATNGGTEWLFSVRFISPNFYFETWNSTTIANDTQLQSFSMTINYEI